MERELSKLVEAAVKAAEAAAVDGVSANGPEVCLCVSSLKQLKNFPITPDFLASTQVDKKLRHLKNHNKEKVRLMARWLLESRSHLIKAHPSKNILIDAISSTKSTKFESTRKIKRKTDGNCLFPGPAKRPKFCSRNLDEVEAFTCFKKPPQEANVSKEAQRPVRIKIKYSSAWRNKVREILVEALSKVVGEVADDHDSGEMKEHVRGCDPVEVAATVESVMFKKMGPFNGVNKLKYRSILFNVKDPKNPDFRRKMLLGQVKPERLVTMTTEEMASDQRQCENNQMKQKASLHREESVGEESSVGSAGDESRWLES